METDTTDPQLLNSTIKVCMFDQYGTVVDIQTGLVEAATPFLKGKNWPGNPNSFVTWWRRAHFENSMIDALLGKEHTPYREIGERAVAFVMDRAGISHAPEEVHALVAAIERLKPFSEMPTALDRLRTRYKLAVLSNGDPDMLETAAWLATAKLRTILRNYKISNLSYRVPVDGRCQTAIRGFSSFPCRALDSPESWHARL